MVILSYALGSCRRPWAPRRSRSRAPEVAVDTRPPCLVSLAVLVALTGPALSAVSVLETSQCLLVWVPPAMYLIRAPQSPQSLCYGPDRAPSFLFRADVTNEAAERVLQTDRDWKTRPEAAFLVISQACGKD